jgi:hypothetical protein
VTKETLAKQMLKIIDEDLQALHYEMKELDRQYIERQKRVRELKKTKEKILEEMGWTEGHQKNWGDKNE